MRKLSGSLLGLVILVTGVCGLTAAETLQVKKRAYVTVSVLNYRDQPSIKGKKKGFFTLATNCYLVKKSAHKEKIGDKEDYWYYIEASNKKGWVFGAFLSAAPVLSKAQLQETLRGTYYYGRDHKVNASSNILTIKGDIYKEKRFYYDGSYTEFTGTVVYQAYDIMLVPTVKTFHATEYQKSAYGQNYHNTDKPIKLQWNAQKNYRKKYYIITCDHKSVLSETKVTCSSLGEVYFKK
jgi:hypothetical protein